MLLPDFKKKLQAGEKNNILSFYIPKPLKSKHAARHEMSYYYMFRFTKGFSFTSTIY